MNSIAGNKYENAINNLQLVQKGVVEEKRLRGDH
jgi:hypothetical protein